MVILWCNLNIVNNERLCQGPKYWEPKQICFDEAREEIQTGIDQFIERISNDKGIHKNHFLEWKSHVMLSVNEKNVPSKIKLTCRSVKSTFTGYEVKNIVFP